MKKKNKKTLLIVAATLGILAVGAVGYGSAGFTSWDAATFRNRFVTPFVPNEADRLQIILDNDAPVAAFNYLEDAVTETVVGLEDLEDFTSFLLLNSIAEATYETEANPEFSYDAEKVVITVDYVEGSTIVLTDVDGEFLSAEYEFATAGSYDFSGIVIEEDDQVLAPSYKALYAPLQL